MGIANHFDKIDDALLAQASLSTVRGMLFALRDQAEALEESLHSLELRWSCDPLSKENAHLRTSLDEAYESIERLQVEARERNSDRPGAQNRILVCIAYLGPHTTGDLVESLDFENESINFHLHELQNIDFLDVDHEFQWALRRDGRRYLSEHGLFEL